MRPTCRCALQPVAPEVARALRWGVWMDGFEERRPGVLGGMGRRGGIDSRRRDHARRRASRRRVHPRRGAPIASGRWAFGWTASRGGFETTDGGMSWTKEIALPEPIAEPRAGRDRHCGPVGCLTAGWLRVGWGAPAPAAPLEAPPNAAPGRAASARSGPRLRAAGRDAPGRRPGAPAGVGTQATSRAVRAHPARGVSRRLELGGGLAVPCVRGPRRTPVMPGELGLSIDASHPLERGLRPRPLARAYAWGPSAGDWHPSGHWQVRWLWPWQGAPGAGPEERSSAVAAPPWASLELAARALAGTMGVTPGVDARAGRRSRSRSAHRAPRRTRRAASRAARAWSRSRRSRRIAPRSR